MYLLFKQAQPMPLNGSICIREDLQAKLVQEKLLKALYDFMSSERMSDDRENITKLRAIVVI